VVKATSVPAPLEPLAGVMVPTTGEEFAAYAKFEISREKIGSELLTAIFCLLLFFPYYTSNFLNILNK